MAAIKSSEIVSIRYGTIEAKALYYGNKKIWPNKYLRIIPQLVFLTPGNQYTEDVNVHSNVGWNIE